MTKKPKMHLGIYRDHHMEWRWRMKLQGNILADSGEGYKRHANCVKGLRSIVRHLDYDTLEIEDFATPNPILCFDDLLK